MVSFTTDVARRPTSLGHVRLSTGVTLHYAAQGPTAGPAVILLHGYSDSWFSFSRVLPLLTPQTRVIACAAVLLGLFVGSLLALAIDYLDDTLKTADDVERALGTITLGRIPRPLVLLTAPPVTDGAAQRIPERAR